MNNARSALTIETAEVETERKSKTYQKDQSAVTPLRQNKRIRTNSGSIDISDD